MNELFKAIEEQIRLSGYPKAVDGREFYNEISDEADEQGNGRYLFVIKKSDTLSYHGCMDIMEHEFDLHFVDIHDGDTVYHVDFDV